MVRALGGPVERLLREVASDIVMPRFRSLQTSEIEEKTPGDVLTVADRESETRLTEALLALLPGSRVMGEEAESVNVGSCSDPGRGAVWIVDPLDGTSNFAEGNGPFAIMIALAIDGEAEASWILDPQTTRLCSAVRGEGAAIGGERVRAQASGSAVPLAAVAMHFSVRRSASGHCRAVSWSFADGADPSLRGRTISACCPWPKRHRIVRAHLTLGPCRRVSVPA